MGEMEKVGEKRGAKVDGDKRRIRVRRQRNKKTTRKRGERAALYVCLSEDGRLFFGVQSCAPNFVNSNSNETRV